VERKCKSPRKPLKKGEKETYQGKFRIATRRGIAKGVRKKEPEERKGTIPKKKKDPRLGHYVAKNKSEYFVERGGPHQSQKKNHLQEKDVKGPGDGELSTAGKSSELKSLHCVGGGRYTLKRSASRDGNEKPRPLHTILGL